MACKLRQKPDSIDFEADIDAEVNLLAEDHIGNVMIKKARYGTTELVAEGTAVSVLKFKVESGTKRLVLVFVFAPQDALGELVEVCGDEKSHLLDIAGDEPRQSFNVEGK